jgi:hypothetical protein
MNDFTKFLRSTKPAARMVAGRSPAMGFTFLFMTHLKATCLLGFICPKASGEIFLGWENSM